MSSADGLPAFRIVRGAPTAEEVAALVGVLLMRSPGGAPDRHAPGSAWVRNARPGAFDGSGMPARPSPSGWRDSALPR